MPKVRRTKKAPPEGWELIAPTIDELDKKMRDGKCACLKFFQISSQ
jgi:bud site selection protein 31